MLDERPAQPSPDEVAWRLASPVLACPTCRGSLERVERGAISCASCGRTGVFRHGILDFLHDTPLLAGAAGAEFDLRADEELAERLAADPAEAARALTLLSEEVRGCTVDKLPGHAQRGRERYAKWFAQIQPPVGPEAGLGILDKIRSNSHDPDLPLSGDVALEAGAGAGFHVPGFARCYRVVLVADCSLANLVLAQAVARATSTDNAVMVRADVQHLPLHSQSIALVHENGVIEHVADPQAMVREALRVLSPDGVYICLSPNKYPITREPHFRLPLFGAWPAAVRRYAVPRVSGHLAETGTQLRSLAELQAYFAEEGVEVEVFFLPRNLIATVRSTASRRLVQRCLAQPQLRRLLLFLANRALLPVAPYHFAVARGGATASTRRA